MNSVEEIYNQVASPSNIDDAIQLLDGTGDTATALKEDVTNGSSVSRNRLFRWVIAYCMWAQRVLFNQYRNDVEDLARNGHYGTARWFVQKALDFQYGHELIFTKKDAYYADDNEEARIVGYAAVVELGYKVIVKVIGKDYALLNTDQVLGVNDYFDELRPPLPVVVICSPADRLWLDATIVYDAKQGLPNIKANVDVAVNEFVRNLGFNGVLNRTKLKLTMLAAPGVIDVVFHNVRARANATETWIDVNRIYHSYAGWMTVDTDHPISNLNWISSNV